MNHNGGDKGVWYTLAREINNFRPAEINFAHREEGIIYFKEAVYG